jgi:hypothetical protein
MKRDYEQEFRAEFPDVDVQVDPHHQNWGRSSIATVEGRDFRGWKWKALFTRWRIPYGLWTCEGGREIIFNRDYKPIWERKGGKVKPGNPKEWVKFIDQRWFHSDGPNKPSPSVLKLAEKVLADFNAGKDVRHYLDNLDDVPVAQGKKIAVRCGADHSASNGAGHREQHAKPSMT